ncbi:MAG TPA: CHRD domain-containing protein [Lapillicoccus sp.]|nr:CHRD domain-containing protein [Lapillicoccus sp.]
MLTRVRPLAAAALAAAALAAGAGPALAKPPATPAIPLNTEQETTGSNTGAHGFLSYHVDGDQFCYVLDVTGLSGAAVAAHIHLAPRHVAGPVKIPLAIPSAADFTTSGCTTVSDSALLADVQANPKAYYINVHTALFPGGEVRGQLK